VGFCIREMNGGKSADGKTEGGLNGFLMILWRHIQMGTTM
jgi:hypothetical protein